MDNLNHNQVKEIVYNSLALTKKNKFLIALSGGIDSTLLLSMLNEISVDNKYKIKAIHINHNISKDAQAMENHCVNICKQLKIELVIKKINDEVNSNIEENLRNKRYELMFDTMKEDEALLLGHHANDQVETFLYRLFRGSSPHGLSCMDTISYRASKILCRPFLSITRENIIDIGRLMNIEYINDTSNNNINFDRNYIRNEIIPKIKTRWRSVDNTMLHNISLQSDYSKLASDYCDSVYKNIVDNNKLNIKILKSYPCYLESTFLKYWIKSCCQYDLSRNEISQIQLIIKSENHDYPQYKLKNDIALIRYKDVLYLNKPTKKIHIENKTWDMQHDVTFGNLTISLNKLKERGLYHQLCSKAPVILKLVRGQEKIMLNNVHYQDLKKVFQSNSVPTWERDKFVLFFSNEVLLLAYGENHMFISSELR